MRVAANREDRNMLMRSRQLTNAVGVLLLLVVCGGWPDAARADASPAAQRPGTIYLAQLSQAQSACATTCGKRCEADNKACTLNGKAPQALINSTCSPQYSSCTSKCTASCYK